MNGATNRPIAPRPEPPAESLRNFEHHILFIMDSVDETVVEFPTSKLLLYSQEISRAMKSVMGDRVGSPGLDLVELANDGQSYFEATVDQTHRKTVGHYGTPATIARFMCSLYDPPPKDAIRVLDPGAGTGTLSLAMCERLLRIPGIRNVSVHAFETDATLANIFNQVMEAARDLFVQRGKTLAWKIFSEDFILANHGLQEDLPGLGRPPFYADYDVVIMNPPYYKLRGSSQQAKTMGHIVSGQPNIYALFMMVAAEMLRPGGTFVSITPRSFCNGPYFETFRRSFLGLIRPRHFHLFARRDKAFEKDGVLQETIITAGMKDQRNEAVTISTSASHDFDDFTQINTTWSVVNTLDSVGSIIRIPQTEADVRVLCLVDSLPTTFSEAGYRVSTGPVVAFRAKRFLRHGLAEQNGVPLLSMQNVKPFATQWLTGNQDKSIGFAVETESSKLLVPSRDYILLRRFSAKEEKRRLVASVFLATKWPWQVVALENHLNYIYRVERDFNPFELYGLCAFLNSRLIDRYFRARNGLTQVNAADIRVLPLPTERILEKVGRMIADGDGIESHPWESCLSSELAVPPDIIEYLSDLYP